MGVRKVIVTGFGALTPYGEGVPLMMENLEVRKSAVTNMKAEWESAVSDLNSWVGAPLLGELDSKSIPRKFRKTMGRSARKNSKWFINLCRWNNARCGL